MTLSSLSAAGRVYGALLIALSAISFGAMAIFARFAYADGADLYGVLILRFGGAGLILLAVALVRRVPWPRRSSLFLLAAMGGLGYVGMSYCYFAALNYVPASLVALLLYTFPIIVTVMAALFLHEPITPVKLGALVLCGVGTLLTIGSNAGIGTGGTAGIGVMLGLGAAVIYAGYIVVGAKVARGIDPMVTTAVVCLAAGGVFLTLGIGRGLAGLPPHFPATAAGWAGVAGVTLISTVIAVIAFFAGMTRLGASLSSVLSTLEPVVTVGLAAWLLSESLIAWQWVGGALTLSGVIWLATTRPAKPRELALEGE